MLPNRLFIQLFWGMYLRPPDWFSAIYGFILESYWLPKAHQGIYDKKVSELSRYKDQHCKNASRILHAFVHRKGKTLSVPVTPVDVPVRLPSKRKVMNRPWPVLLLSDWIRTTCEDPHYGGFFVLGGKKLDRWDEIKETLRTFWSRHCKIDAVNVPSVPEQTIPFLLHGDEGRGQGKKPILVIGYQPMIPWAANDVVNSEKCFGLIWGLVAKIHPSL